jgi:ubiquitin C-terminal hydrolase
MEPYKSNSEEFVFFEPKPTTFEEDSLESCLANQSKVDFMEDKKNLYHCELCTADKYSKKTNKVYKAQALKRYLILEPPQCLIINLKRFSQTGYFFSKNSKTIDFKLYLSLDDFTIHRVPKLDKELVE